MKISMESAGTGVVNEIELEIYGRLKDLEQLKALAASTEPQEQWGIYIPRTDKNNATGNQRVRYTPTDEYVHTSKIKYDNGNDEVNTKCTEQLMDHYRKFADSGLKKIRYVVPVPDTELCYEVDVFENENGISNWVKVDLELPPGYEIDTIPNMPFDLEDIRIIQPGIKNKEDLDFVRKLFDEEFNLRLPKENVSTESYTSEDIVDGFYRDLLA